MAEVPGVIVPVVAIGDIGVLDGMIHLGDEAMFESCVERMRERGVERIVAVSAQPSESARRYGIQAVQRIGFAGQDRAAAQERMQRVIRTASGEPGLLPAGDPAHAVIAAVRDCDGVVICGGGNLSSLWPAHILERATLGELARLARVPLVVSGQTIGPELVEADRRLVRELLSSAALVGLREARSLQLCRSLGVPAELLHRCVDDASFLVDEDAALSESGAERYCLVSLAGHVGSADREAVAAAIARLLDGISTDLGLRIVFLAHFAALDPAAVRGDSLMQQRVRDRMTERSTVQPTTDPVAAARLARAAAFVVSSRYHPVVFAVPAGVPAIGISVDRYTDTKLRGALENFGQSSLLPVSELVAGGGPALVERSWADRDRSRAQAMTIAAAARRDSGLWWDRVAATVRA